MLPVFQGNHSSDDTRTSTLDRASGPHALSDDPDTSWWKRKSTSKSRRVSFSGKNAMRKGQAVESDVTVNTIAYTKGKIDSPARSPQQLPHIGIVPFERELPHTLYSADRQLPRRKLQTALQQRNASRIPQQHEHPEFVCTNSARNEESDSLLPSYATPRRSARRFHTPNNGGTPEITSLLKNQLSRVAKSSPLGLSNIPNPHISQAEESRRYDSDAAAAMSRTPMLQPLSTPRQPELQHAAKSETFDSLGRRMSSGHAVRRNELHMIATLLLNKESAFPHPPPPAVSTNWMDWNDPLCDVRKARRLRSRVIKNANASTMRSVFRCEEAGVLTASAKGAWVKPDWEEDQELGKTAELLNTKLQPPQRPQKSKEASLGKMVELKVGSDGDGDRKHAEIDVRTPVSHEVQWDVQTMAERAYLFKKERPDDTSSGLGIHTLISQQGEIFEGHCKTGILEAGMRTVQWGERGAPTALGGLAELDESMKLAEGKIPGFLERIERGTQLMTALDAESTKAMLLEGQAHAEATGIMAKHYFHNFGGAQAPEEVSRVTAEEMKEEDLDNVLADMFLDASKASLVEQPIQKGPVIPKNETEGKTEAIELGQQKIHNADVMQHVAFHRDISYIKYKTAVFKKTMKDRNLGPNILDLSKQVINPAGVDHHLWANRTMHYLRVCFLEADHLPIMDMSKQSKGDIYVRCTLFAGDQIVYGYKGEEIVTTKVAWNTKKPCWKEEEFEFIIPHSDEDVVLRVEVRDVDISGYGQGSLDDHFIGELEFLILQEGTQVMVSELEYEEWYLLRNKDKSDVRHNLGVEQSVLKGRGSVLKVRHIYTKKPRLSRAQYAKRIQCNFRCFLARLRTREARADRKKMVERADKCVEMEGMLTTERIWHDYKAECVKNITHPISKVRAQLTSSEIQLDGYVVSYHGVLALSKALKDAASLGRLRNLVLKNMELRGQMVVELVEAIKTEKNQLQLLKLDGNPLTMEPLHGSMPHNPATNRLARGITAAKAVADLLDETRSLTCLSMANTQLGDNGIEVIADAVGRHPYMTSLDISGNNSTNNPGDMLGAARAVGRMLAETESLIELDYSWNNLSNSAGLEFLGFNGGEPMHSQGLYRNETLRRLVVNKTALLKHLPACQALTKTIAKSGCTLDFLDISNCDLKEQGNVEAVAEGIIVNSGIRILVIDGNPVGWHGYRALMARGGRRRYVGSWTRKAEGGTTHPAAKSMQEVLEIFRSFDVDESGNMDREEFGEFLTQLGFTKSGWTDKDMSAVFNTIDADKSGIIDFAEFYAWYCEELVVGEDGESAMQVSMKNCAVNIKEANFDGADPDGTYDLDMSLMRSRTILLTLMKLVYSGKGEFVEGTVTRSTPSTSVQGEYTTELYTIETPPDISSWVIPRSGYISFDFVTSVTTQTSSIFINLNELLELRKKLEGTILNGRGARETLLNTHLTPGRILTYHQALDLLKVYLNDGSAEAIALHLGQQPPSTSVQGTTRGLEARERRASLSKRASLSNVLALPRNSSMKGISSEERIAFVIRLFLILNSMERDTRILEVIPHAERSKIEDLLGIIMHPWEARVPSGYQRLRLNKVSERGLCLQLIELCNEMKAEQEGILAAAAHRGSKDPLNFVWRNARLNGRMFFFEKHWRVPYTGTLELDFVDIRTLKPSESNVIPDAKFRDLLAKLQDHSLTHRDRVIEVRRTAMTYDFRCLHVVGLLCTLPVAEASWRAELLVTLYGRILDWRGFRTLLFHLPILARETLLQRLGKPALFHDGASSAVGYWKLGLSYAEDRYLAQELIHRAAKVSACGGEGTRGLKKSVPGEQEPGSNLLDCEYNGSAFEVPSSWLSTVPREGWISFFYTREQHVLDVCRSQGRWGSRQAGTKEVETQSFPPLFYLPVIPVGYDKGREGLQGTWVHIEKIRLVKETLQRRVSTLAEVFAVLDVDGGGSLSRVELSTGLAQNGIWLSPPDMEMLLNMIDVDNSGEIDLAEFKDFWQNAPPLRFGDYPQESYWATRGIRGRRYEEMVPFYDMRAQYPKDFVKRLGLDVVQCAPCTNHEEV